MKKILFCTILSGLLPLYSIAQDGHSKIHEIGLSFYNLNGFGIRYKSGSPNTLLRLTLLSVHGTNQNSTPDSISHSNRNNGFGINLGFEKRESINDKWGTYYGMDFLTSFTSNSYKDEEFNQKENNWRISPGLGIVLGLDYKINDEIHISAEIVPSVRYSYGKSTRTDYSGVKKETISGFDYDLSNSGVQFTLSFQFGPGVFPKLKNTNNPQL